MGRYDDIDPEELRHQLVRVAELILQLDEDGALLREAPRLQKVFGDLRQRLFAYEVRSTAALDAEVEASEDDETGAEDADSLLRESLRIVQEAKERQEELRDELAPGRPRPEDEDEEENDEG